MNDTRRPSPTKDLSNRRLKRHVPNSPFPGSRRRIMCSQALTSSPPPVLLLKHDTAILSNTSSKQLATERLGERVLKTISDEKQSIAELRPARRKIKWNSTLSDWDRRDYQSQQLRNRISSIQLNDLQLHGINQQCHKDQPTARQDSKESFHDNTTCTPSLDPSKDVLRNPGEHIDALENNIRRCFRTLRRVLKENTEMKEQCQRIEQENIQLRRQLISMNGPPHPRQQSIRQSQTQIKSNIDRMKEKLAELDEQLGMLKMQKKSVDADCLILHEIVDETAEEEHDMNKSINDDDICTEAKVASEEIGSDVQLHDLFNNELTHGSADLDFVLLTVVEANTTLCHSAPSHPSRSEDPKFSHYSTSGSHDQTTMELPYNMRCRIPPTACCSPAAA